MLSKDNFSGKTLEAADNPILSPCRDCGDLVRTKRFWCFYDSKFNPTDVTVSLERCESCHAKWQAKNDIKLPGKNPEYPEESVVAPCPDCGDPVETQRIWRTYDEALVATGEIVSMDRCETCHAAWLDKPYVIYPGENYDHLIDPVIAPCKDCGNPAKTTRLLLIYDENLKAIYDVASDERCESCHADWLQKIAEHKAEVARREAEREARRQEIYARARANKPQQPQFELGID